MLDYLLERDREEALRTSTRRLAFPDETVRDIEAYRVVWRWFDHLVSYEFSLDAPEILDRVLRTMQNRQCDEGEALGLVVEYLVFGTEACGGDVTDDTLPLDHAKSQMAKWQRRKSV